MVIDLNAFGEVSGWDLKQGTSGSSYTHLFKTPYKLPEVVIHLAGHSSVPSCDLDPLGSLQNNCNDFIQLVKTLYPYTRFIYASSGSVYGSTGNTPAKETDKLKTPIKLYDSEKQLIDHFMGTYKGEFYGLRFGTVCGYSPNPRNELMINSMVRDACLKKEVTISSAKNYRAILSLRDLCKAITLLVEKDAAPGFYNLASVNSMIGDIGEEVASLLDVPLKVNEIDSSSYSFCLDTSKFCDNLDFEFKDTVEYMVAEALNNDFLVERQWEKLKKYFVA